MHVSYRCKAVLIAAAGLVALGAGAPARAAVEQATVTVGIHAELRALACHATDRTPRLRSATLRGGLRPVVRMAQAKPCNMLLCPGYIIVGIGF